MSNHFQFLMETPAETDAFEAGSHQRIANSILETISHDNVNVIGIEGELGSGKSTVIRLLEPKCKGAFEMIPFDVEKYQHGATKKALIETIFKKLSHDLLGEPHLLQEIKEAKDTALGNRLKYDVKVTSKVDGWVRECKKICVSGILPMYLKGHKNASIRPAYRPAIS